MYRFPLAGSGTNDSDEANITGMPFWSGDTEAALQTYTDKAVYLQDHSVTIILLLALDKQTTACCR